MAMNRSDACWRRAFSQRALYCVGSARIDATWEYSGAGLNDAPRTRQPPPPRHVSLGSRERESEKTSLSARFAMASSNRPPSTNCNNNKEGRASGARRAFYSVHFISSVHSTLEAKKERTETPGQVEIFWRRRIKTPAIYGLGS